MISPRNVIMIVEKRKALSPAITEFDSNVSSTLIPTFPQRMVVSRKLEFLRKAAIRIAALFLRLDSISRFSLVMLKNARFNPENMADCDMQNSIPIQISIFMSSLLSMVHKFSN